MRLSIGRHPTILDGRPSWMPGRASDWPAVGRWSPRSLARRFWDLRVHAQIDLPVTGSPYEQTAEGHSAEMGLGDLVKRIETAPTPSYLDQEWLARLPGLMGELRYESILPAGSEPKYVNLWLGSKDTNSGLHFDLQDNLIVQIYGRKRVHLVSPEETGRLYPYPDLLLKSRVDAGDPDLSRFPAFAKVTVLEAILEPGDVLYLPKLWWHQLRSLEAAISVNLWHGRSAAPSLIVAMLWRCGPVAWLSVARDFWRLGVMGRPFRRRLFCSAPAGKRLYDALVRPMVIAR